jgi:Polyketide cyclase / dehydrase and lipid transport
VANYGTTIESVHKPEETFEYLATFSNAAEWDPGVATGQPLQSGPPEVGAIYRLGIPLARWKATFDYRVVEIERPRRVVLRAEHPLARSIDTITVEPGRSGSVVHYDAVLEPRGLLRVFAPVISHSFRAIGDRAATGLRAALG